jgi:hypothetical protein
MIKNNFNLWLNEIKNQYWLIGSAIIISIIIYLCYQEIYPTATLLFITFILAQFGMWCAVEERQEREEREKNERRTRK